jgi:hypothetical protein
MFKYYTRSHHSKDAHSRSQHTSLKRRNTYPLSNYKSSKVELGQDAGYGATHVEKKHPSPRPPTVYRPPYTGHDTPPLYVNKRPKRSGSIFGRQRLGREKIDGHSKLMRS